MIRPRPLFVLLLGLALAASSVTVAIARGPAAASHQVVICTGTGVTTLAVDAQGRPVGPVHPCPDCLAGLMTAALPDPATLATALSAPTLVPWLPAPQASAGPLALPPCARGPPLRPC